MRVSTLFFAAVLTACSDRAGDAPMPGPHRDGRAAEIARLDAADAAELEARCEGCHGAIADEQRRSLHRAATTDPSYVRALAIEPKAFCRGCHAPEADPRADAPLALGTIGVGCVSCHVSPNGVLAGPSSGASANAPHAVVRDARFGGEGACSGCHEFDFPAPHAPAEKMQRTIAEHRASPRSAASCASCHMPDVNEPDGRRHKSHAFVASRNEAFVRSAVAIEMTRPRSSIVHVELRPGLVGHAFPTGDLFRRITVVAEVTGDDFALLAHAEAHLARHFGSARAGLTSVRTELTDDRVGPENQPRVVDLDLGAEAENMPARVRAIYERVAQPLSIDGERAIVEGSVVLADRELSASH